MKEMLTYLRLKMQQEKGEVSIEWALVAVVMAIIIIGAFMPGVQTGLQTAITKINGMLNNP
jgi:Flp pilus assembly pilin Flp